MKRLSIFFLVTTLSVSQAQTSIPTFVNEKNQWHEAFCCVDFGSGDVDCWLTRYFFRDTIHLNNKTYHKLYNSSPPNYNDLNFTNMIYREDSIGNVYLVEIAGDEFSEEYLIYRFDVNVGDTLELGESGNINFALKVTAIDTVTLQSGVQRKRLTLKHLRFNEERYWIEGVGANYAPLDTRLMFSSDCWMELACYQYEGIIEYETDQCNLRTGVHEPTQTTFATIFPNPFTNELNIQSFDNKSFTLQVFDALGKLLLQQFVSDHPFSVNMYSFPAGVYYLRLRDESGNFQTEKCVKMK